MFSECPRGPDSVASRVRGQTIKFHVAEGDQVDLMVDDETILVRDVELVRQGLYRGAIFGFKSLVVEYKGLVLGQSVEFTETQVFACTATV
jgi:hypothetical protein